MGGWLILGCPLALVGRTSGPATTYGGSATSRGRSDMNRQTIHPTGWRGGLATLALMVASACGDDGAGSGTPVGDFAPLGLGGNEIGACYQARLACLPTGSLEHFTLFAVEISVVVYRDGVATGLGAWPLPETTDPGLDYSMSSYFRFRRDVPNLISGNSILLLAAIEREPEGRIVFLNDTATGEYEGGNPFALDVGLSPVSSARGEVLPATLNGAWIESLVTGQTVSYPALVPFECIVPPDDWLYEAVDDACP